MRQATIGPNELEGIEATNTLRPVHVLLLVTGSVAAVKLGLLLDEIAVQIPFPQCEVRIACTTPALHFIHRAQPSRCTIPFSAILTDRDEWSRWKTVQDEVLHIALRRWADCVLIAPMDANSLAKITSGLCDNLVTCVMRAWEVGRKPVIICPAMNTAMWQHPCTEEQLWKFCQLYSAAQPQLHLTCSSPPSGKKASNHSLYDTRSAGTKMRDPPNFSKGFDAAFSASSSSLSSEDVGAAEVECTVSPSFPTVLEDAMVQIVWPVKKRLACGDIGMGGMASVQKIAGVLRHTVHLLQKRQQQESKCSSVKSSSSSSPDTLGVKEKNCRAPHL